MIGIVTTEGGLAERGNQFFERLVAKEIQPLIGDFKFDDRLLWPAKATAFGGDRRILRLSRLLLLEAQVALFDEPLNEFINQLIERLHLEIALFVIELFQLIRRQQAFV